MPDPRAVPVDEVRERLIQDGIEASESVEWVLDHPEIHPNVLRGVGLRCDGTQYLDTEGSQE